MRWRCRAQPPVTAKQTMACTELLPGRRASHMHYSNTTQVVQAFRSEQELRDFRDWVLNPDEAALREAATSPAAKRRKKRKAAAVVAAAEGEEEDGAAAEGGGTQEAEEEEQGEARAEAYKRTHQKLRKNWDLPERFPDARIIKAYAEVVSVLPSH